MQASKLAGRFEATTEQSRILADKPDRRDLVVLLLLFACQAFCFLPVCFLVGFYLDDWLTFWNLHFTAHNLIDLLNAAFADGRMVTRPVQCVYYAITYLLFADRPLGYHLLNFFLEYAGVACLYLGLKRLSLSRFVAALTALVFILYPSHDATHYWIGGGLGAGFGLTLFLASFCFSVYAFSSQRKLLYVLAVAFYALSAFCYEAYLPMLVMSFCSILLLAAQRRTESRLHTMGSVVWWFVPFLLVGLPEPIYQRVLLPRIANIFLSPSCFDPAYFINVFVQGLNVSCFAGLWSFLAQRVREEVLTFNLFSAGQILAVAVSAAGVVFVSFTDEFSVRYRRLFTAAILTFFASYLTFAVALGYTPVLDSMVNRVNTGASVAVSIILALSINWLIDHTGIKGKTALAVSLVLTLPLVLTMTLSDLGLSSFWIRSWQAQKDIRFLVKEKADRIPEKSSILLAGTNRYLNWAPVFDGTWDFQSMLSMTVNRKKASGGVICDRLCIKGDKIQDISAGYLCAEYPVRQITVLFPSEAAWIQVGSVSEFINLCRKKQKQFGLSSQTLQRWLTESVR